MQRFYPILSALVPFVVLLGLRHPRFRQPVVCWIMGGALVAGCAYSLIEARKFISRGRNVTSTAAFTAQRLRGENAILSRYSYEMYGRLPRYFSQGPMAPLLQNRLLAADTLEIVQTNLRDLLAQPESTSCSFKLTDYGGRFEPKLSLKPGSTYLVAFDFGSRLPEGVLELIGHTIYRQYPLSVGMEPLGFRDAPAQENGFALWTTGKETDEVEVRFYATPGQPKPDASAKLRLIAINPETLPLRLKSLIPYELSISATQNGWLETPKLFIPGYVASVDSRPVPSFRSPDGLLMIPVQAGKHEIKLVYQGSLILRGAFWFTLAAWLAALAAICLPRRLLPRWQNPPATALILLGRIGAPVAVVALLAAGAFQAFAHAVPASRLADHGPIALRLAFPIGHDHKSETVLTTRRDNHEIGLFAHYTDGQHVILGFTRDGAPLMVSGPLPINYVLPHDLEVSCGGGTPYRIVIDQRVAIDQALVANGRPAQPPSENLPAGLPPPTPFSGRIIAAQPLRDDANARR